MERWWLDPCFNKHEQAEVDRGHEEIAIEEFQQLLEALREQAKQHNVRLQVHLPIHRHSDLPEGEPRHCAIHHRQEGLHRHETISVGREEATKHLRREERLVRVQQIPYLLGTSAPAVIRHGDDLRHGAVVPIRHSDPE